MKIQYMVAIPLIFGRLTTDDYTDAVAADPRIDALREKVCMQTCVVWKVSLMSTLVDGMRGR